MMLRALLLILAALIVLPVQAETVPAPSVWTETMRGATRVITRGTTHIEIWPWQSLNGKPIDDWLNDFRNLEPKGMRLLSSKLAQYARSGVKAARFQSLV